MTRIDVEQVNDRDWLFKEDDECRALFLEGKLLDIVLPPQVALHIVAPAPPVRGGSDSTWEPARLETGLEIMAPLFLDKGGMLRVDTAPRKYAGKSAREK